MLSIPVATTATSAISTIPNTPATHTDIGALIAHHRSGRRILLSIAAQDTRLNPARLEAIESGAAQPTIQELLSIAAALKMPLAELLLDPNSVGSREHLVELPYEEYDAIATGAQNVLILRNSKGYRTGDTLYISHEDLPGFPVNVTSVHMCEMMKSITFRVPPGFVVVELGKRGRGVDTN